MFTNSTIAFAHARAFVFNKTNLYSGGTNYSVLIDTNRPAILAPTLTPTLTYDNTLETMYLMTVWRPTNGMLRVYSITGAVDSPRLFATTNMPRATNFAWAHTNATANTNTAPGDFGDQATLDGVNIDLNDSRISAPVIYRNGSL